MECAVCFGLYCNADIGLAEIRTLCILRKATQFLMRTAMHQMRRVKNTPCSFGKPSLLSPDLLAV
jgi:hypothetical protein